MWGHFGDISLEIEDEETFCEDIWEKFQFEHFQKCVCKVMTSLRNYFIFKKCRDTVRCGDRQCVWDVDINEQEVFFIKLRRTK